MLAGLFMKINKKAFLGVKKLQMQKKIKNKKE